MNQLEVVARDIATVYGKNNKVISVMMAGSVSRNLSDEFSDIEIYVLWEDGPTDAERKQTISQLDGKILSFFDFEDEEWSEAYSVNGIKIEVSNFLYETIKRFIGDVTVSMETEIEKQLIVSSIQDGIPLFGLEKVIDLKKRVQTYPNELQVKMVECQLFFSSRWTARDAFIHRGDFFIYQKVASDSIEKILLILHGLNGRYVVHPAFKWLTYTIDQLERKPADLEKRIFNIINNQTEQSVRDLETLLEETVDLIVAHLPTVEVEEFKKQIRGTRA
ncbi:DUF4037 domain-containing protein [Bacillus sp. 1P10SD]|uniref:DUF4037 domain-containing protein n=1 Tax=Bacillus sp. 1P10SD TaxID=3132265 RepID=UPI0039A42699